VYADNRARCPGCYLASCHLWTETLRDVFISGREALDFPYLDREEIADIIIALVINRRMANRERMDDDALESHRVSSRV